MEIDRNYYDRQSLRTVVDQIFDESKLMRRSEREARELAAITAKWAPVLGDSMKVDGRVINMKPVPQEIGPNKVWPMLAMLLENQLEMNPAPRNFEEFMMAATTSSHITLPITHTLPVIREVFPNLFMLRICSVQPMPPSSGGTANAAWWRTYREDTTPEQQSIIPSSDYALSGEGQIPKRMRGGLELKSVTAQTMTLAATWTQDVEEDLLGAMGIDIQSEMLRAMTREIQHELEQIVLAEIEGGANAGNVDWTAPDTENISLSQHFEGLFHAIIEAQALIYKKMFRDTNYLVAGMNAVPHLLKSQRFQAAGESVEFGGGTRLEGTYNVKWTVFSSPYVDEDKIIVSYFPTDIMHAGYIYMPYVPLMPMPRVFAGMVGSEDSSHHGAYYNTNSWTQNVRTRFGRYLCEPNMFATVTIKEGNGD